MFGSIGMPELILIFIVALLVFGPKKLPEIGRSIGKGLAEFKRASDELKKTIEQEIEQGKHEISSVRESVAGVSASIKATTAETAAEKTVSAGGAADKAASAEAAADKAASAEGTADVAALSPDSARPPDSRPIEPS